MGGALNPNTLHSPPVSSMLDKIAQFLKLFMFFPGVKTMTSTS